MKIKENVKEFLKNNWKPICIVAGGTVLVCAGMALGHKLTLSDIKNITKIDFGRDYAYNVKDGLLKEFYKDGVLLDGLKKAGFTSLDEAANITLLIQKK